MKTGYARWRWVQNGFAYGRPFQISAPPGRVLGAHGLHRNLLFLCRKMDASQFKDKSFLALLRSAIPHFMKAFRQRAIRWEPVPYIPETPCGDFFLESYEDGRLKVLLRYDGIMENDADLQLTFAEVRAFRTFWDGDGDHPPIEDAPRCSGADSGYIWPLLQIEPSAWVESDHFAASIAIAEALSEEAWRHYRFLTLERSLDVLARGTISGLWITERTDCTRIAPKPPEA